jgi:hypothetical protein
MPSPARFVDVSWRARSRSVLAVRFVSSGKIFQLALLLGLSFGSQTFDA